MNVRCAFTVLFITLLGLPFCAADGAPAGNTSTATFPLPANSVILPAPQPFTLSAYDAIQAMAMIWRNRLLELVSNDGSVKIIAVHTLWAVPKGIDAKAFPGHRRRYDLVLNGQPVDWDHTYIEYGQGLINLRLLFTYRNQYPPQNLRYRVP